MMAVASALAAIAPVLAWYLLLRGCATRALGPMVCFGAAAGLGLGTSSLIWWTLIQVPFPSASTRLFVDAMVWTTLLLGVVVAQRRRTTLPPAEHTRAPWSLSPVLVAATLAVVVMGGMAATTFAATSIASPHGSWDAWAVWNVRARFLFLGIPTGWREAFSGPPIEVADYPMLVPAAIARLWTLVGFDTVLVPIGVAAMCAAAVVLVVGTSLRRHLSPTTGLLAAALLLASPAFARWAPSQCADVPLSLYMLLTYVLVAGGMEHRGRSFWLLAGLCAGLTAWTKNEGIVFVPITCLVIAVWAWHRRDGRLWWRPLADFALGAAPALLVVTAFKYSLSPPNLIVDAQSSAHVSQMLTIERLVQILTALGDRLWFSGATTVGILPILVAYLVLAGPARRPATPAVLTLCALALMLVAYVGVYMLTPLNLAWQLSTSLERVVLQLTPSLVWAGMLLRAPTVAARPSA